jgi:hypothetical protein
MVETGVNARLKPQNLFENEPTWIELAKFLFRFFEHSKIDVALDRPQTSQVPRVCRGDRSDDNSSHDGSTASDEMNDPVVQHADDLVVPLSGAMTSSAADTARFPISQPGFPSAIRVFALTHSRRKVGSRQRSPSTVSWVPALRSR